MWRILKRSLMRCVKSLVHTVRKCRRRLFDDKKSTATFCRRRCGRQCERDLTLGWCLSGASNWKIMRTEVERKY